MSWFKKTGSFYVAILCGISLGIAILFATSQYLAHATSSTVVDIPLSSKASISDLAGFITATPLSYDAGNLVDERTGPVVGGITFANSEALYFPDLGSHASFGGASSSFMAEAYVKSAQFNTGGWSAVFGKLDASTNDYAWLVGIDDWGGLYCQFETMTGETTNIFAVNSAHQDPPVLLVDGQWNKLGCSYNSATGEFAGYVNGNRIYSDTVGADQKIMPDSSSPVVVNGATSSLTWYSFNNSIGGLKVYNYIPSYLNVSATDSWEGAVLSQDVAALSDNVYATSEAGEPNTNKLYHSLWYKFIAPSTATYTFDTCSQSSPDTYLILYQAGTPNTLANLVKLSENDDHSVVVCANAKTSRIDASLTQGETYYLQVGGAHASNLGVISLLATQGVSDTPTVTAGTPWTTYFSTTSPDIHVLGHYNTSPLFSLEYQLEGGAWHTCTADDGTIDAQSADESVTCHVTSLTLGSTAHLKFRATGADAATTPEISYLSLDLLPSQAGLSLTNKYAYRTAAGNFVFTGTSSSDGTLTGVSWRTYQAGQGAELDWSSCTADDSAFDSSSESFTCIAPVSLDNTYHYEFRAQDSLSASIPHAYATALLDSAKQLDTWFSFTSLTDAGQRSGDSRSFGSVLAHGTPTSASGEYLSPAVTFDGTSWFEMSDTTPYLDYAGSARSFHIKASVKPTSGGAGTARTIIYKALGADPATSSYWHLWINESGKAETTMQVGNFSIQDDNNKTMTTNTVNLDAWNNIDVSWDVAGRIGCIKLNDGPVQCAAWTFTDPIYPSLGNVYVGGDPAPPYGHGGNFVGTIGDLQVYRTGDATPPISSITPQPDSDRVTSSIPVFHLDFTDTNGGVAAGEYYVLGSGPANTNTWLPITTPDDGAWGGTTESATITLPELYDGFATLIVRSSDLHGNTSVSYGYATSPYAQAYYTFKVEAHDTTSPYISSNPITPNPSIDRSPAIRGYVKDYTELGQGDTSSNIAGISYSLDGADYVSISSLDGSFDSPKEDFYLEIPSELALGDHTIQVRAVDASGNSTGTNPVGSATGDVLIHFTVTSAPDSVSAETVVKNITFDNHDLHDSIFSDAIWGNGVVRLRQTIGFSEELDSPPVDHDAFGYISGESTLGVYPSVDGNIWLATRNNQILYYDKDTRLTTTYPKELLNPLGLNITNIFEFTLSSRRYLMISSDKSTLIYDINNTPSNTADDPLRADYADNLVFPAGYSHFVPVALDTRGADLAIYGISENGDPANTIMRLDMHSTPMDVTDDTYTMWGHTQGVGDTQGGAAADGITALYFDQAEHRFLAFSYSYGLYVCDDGNTPTNTSDDICTSPWDAGAVPVATQVFAITKDPNGWYWIGGDGGVVRLNLNGTMDRSDDTVTTVLSSSYLGGDNISSLKWIPGVAPVGDEIWAKSRSGRLYGVEYNSTYDDSMDDTNYSYKISNFEYRSGGTSTFYMSDRNTIWVPVPGYGMDKISLTRSYDDTDVVEIYPTPPDNLLEINHVLLSDVVGSVSSGSPYTFGDLVTYEVSNDAGVTWHPAHIGDTIDFNTSDYKLKIRITLHKGSTPILESLSLSYVAQPRGTIVIDEPVTPTPAPGGGDGTPGSPSCQDEKPGTKAPWLYGALRTNSHSTVLYFAKGDEPVTKYVLSYGLSPGVYQYGVSDMGVTKANQMTYLVDSLSPSTPYYFRIRADNGCGTGPWSNELKVTTKGRSFFMPLSTYLPDSFALPTAKPQATSGPRITPNNISQLAPLKPSTLYLLIGLLLLLILILLISYLLSRRRKQ